MINVKEVVLCVAFVMATAIAVNHYAGLDIEFLNDLETTMVPGKMFGEDYPSPGFKAGSPSSELTSQCVATLKLIGSARSGIRSEMAEAEKNGDHAKMAELKDRLNRIEERVKDACQ